MGENGRKNNLRLLSDITGPDANIDRRRVGVVTSQRLIVLDRNAERKRACSNA